MCFPDDVAIIKIRFFEKSDGRRKEGRGEGGGSVYRKIITAARRRADARVYVCACVRVPRDRIFRAFPILRDVDVRYKRGLDSFRINSPSRIQWKRRQYRAERTIHIEFKADFPGSQRIIRLRDRDVVLEGENGQDEYSMLNSLRSRGKEIRRRGGWRKRRRRRRRKGRRRRVP